MFSLDRITDCNQLHHNESTKRIIHFIHAPAESTEKHGIFLTTLWYSNATRCLLDTHRFPCAPRIEFGPWSCPISSPLNLIIKHTHTRNRVNNLFFSYSISQSRKKNRTNIFALTISLSLSQ